METTIEFAKYDYLQKTKFDDLVKLNGWLKKEIAELKESISLNGYDHSDTILEAFDCLGLLVMGADINNLENSDVFVISKGCSHCDDESFDLWFEKQQSRERRPISKKDIGRASVNLVILLSHRNDALAKMTSLLLNSDESGVLVSNYRLLFDADNKKQEFSPPVKLLSTFLVGTCMTRRIAFVAMRDEYDDVLVYTIDESQTQKVIIFDNIKNFMDLFINVGQIQSDWFYKKIS